MEATVLTLVPPPADSLPQYQHLLIEYLEQLLAGAKTGEIVGLLAVTENKDGSVDYARRIIPLEDAIYLYARAEHKIQQELDRVAVSTFE